LIVGTRGEKIKTWGKGNRQKEKRGVHKWGMVAGLVLALVLFLGLFRGWSGFLSGLVLVGVGVGAGLGVGLGGVELEVE